MTEKEKFLNYIEEKIKEGLVGFSLYYDEKPVDKSTDPKQREEEIYAELNRMVEAPTLEDPDLF